MVGALRAVGGPGGLEEEEGGPPERSVVSVSSFRSTKESRFNALSSASPGAAAHSSWLSIARMGSGH